MRLLARLVVPSFAALAVAQLAACHGGHGSSGSSEAPLVDAGATSALPSLPPAALALALASDAAVAPPSRGAPAAPTYFTDVDEEQSADERPADVDDEHPFHHLRSLPAARLGPADTTVRADLSAYCAAREQAYFTRARAAAKGRAAADLGSFESECECKALLVSERFVSVVCEDSTFVDDPTVDPAHAAPETSFAGYSYAIVGGKAQRLGFSDICAPTGPCAVDVAGHLGDASGDAIGGVLADSLAHPVFALGPTSLRLLLPTALAGDSALGISTDVPYAAFGKHARRIPW